MIDWTASGQDYNRFVNLDGMEDRIIYYLLSPNKKTREELEQTEILWKLLYYDDIDALNKPLPDYRDVAKLICADNISQNNFRVFRNCHLEDAWTIQSTFLKIYIDDIMPENTMIAQVNMGIDIIVHNKIINVNVPSSKYNGYGDYCKKVPDEIIKEISQNPNNIPDYTLLQESVPIDKVNGIDYYINQKSRISILVRAILSLLNGADIQGVGKLQFSMEMNRWHQGQYEIWNNRNFEGMKLVLGTRMSGVS